MGVITLTNASLGLKKPVIQLSNPGVSKDSDAVYSGDGLRYLFDSFEGAIKGLKLSPGIAVISSLSILGREYENEIVIKKLEDGKGNCDPGEAAIFKASIDERTGFNESKWGIGRHSRDGSFINPPDNYRHAQRPITVDALQVEFQKFLDKTLPTVLKWDGEFAQKEFDKVHISHHLANWVIVRMLNNLPGGSKVTLGIEEVDIDEAMIWAEAGEVRATKSAIDKVELYTWS